MHTHMRCVPYCNAPLDRDNIWAAIGARLSCVLQRTVHQTRQSALSCPRIIYFYEWSTHSSKTELPGGLSARIGCELNIWIAYCLRLSVWSVACLIILMFGTLFSVVYDSVNVLNTHTVRKYTLPIINDYAGLSRSSFSLKYGQRTLF